MDILNVEIKINRPCTEALILVWIPIEVSYDILLCKKYIIDYEYHYDTD